MKRYVIVLFIVIVTVIRSIGQNGGFELTNLKFKGLGFVVTKEAIIKSHGQAKRKDTNYDCGFFTNDNSRKPYYQLVYTNFNYIGRDNEKFFLQNVQFDAKGKLKLVYGNRELSGQTSIDEFAKIFGDKAKEHFAKFPENNSMILYSKTGDDGARFTFQSGFLVKFEYWTPC